MIIQVLGIALVDKCSSRYASFPSTSLILKGPSQFAASFPSLGSFRASPHFLSTKSPLRKVLGLNLMLYLFSTLFLYNLALIWTSLMVSSARSKASLTFHCFLLLGSAHFEGTVHPLLLISLHLTLMLGEKGFLLFFIVGSNDRPIR